MYQGSEVSSAEVFGHDDLPAHGVQLSVQRQTQWQLRLSGVKTKSLKNRAAEKSGPDTNLLIIYLRNKSPTACFITCPATCEIELVSGISFGQISTQFCAYPHS